MIELVVCIDYLFKGGILPNYRRETYRKPTVGMKEPLI